MSCSGVSSRHPSEVLRSSKAYEAQRSYLPLPEPAASHNPQVSVGLRNATHTVGTYRESSSRMAIRRGKRRPAKRMLFEGDMKYFLTRVAASFISTSWPML